MTTTRHVPRHRHARHQAPVETDPATLPDTVKSALRQAMRLENTPNNQFQDLLWIMAQESSGRVGARNAHSTARGLFQLLRNNYDLNPHGEDSFGNSVEECQGGIRYIVRRYRSAGAARRFWQLHHWY